jgi:tripartite ATP-independent transporter DctP family solute receptor
MKNQRVALMTMAIVMLFVVAQVFVKKSPLGDRHHFLLAHNLAPEHPVHLGMELFAKELLEKSDGRMRVTIYPNGQIGTEKEVLELVQLGAITMTKVSTLSLESFSPLIGILNLPFLFRDRAHYFAVLDSTVGEELLVSSVPQRLRGITYYDAGDRSFYAAKPIMTPDDVVGLKIRVMENATAIRMMQLLGGSPTPMPYGEVYTALQQGVIDGAENNLSALTVNRHGEVSKHYSLVQHIFAPDVLVLSEAAWQSLDTQDQVIVREAAEASKVYQRELWAQKMEQYRKEATEKLQVKIHTPDRRPFMDKVAPLHSEFAQKGEDYERIMGAIKSL